MTELPPLPALPDSDGFFMDTRHVDAWSDDSMRSYAKSYATAVLETVLGVIVETAEPLVTDAKDARRFRYLTSDDRMVSAEIHDAMECMSQDQIRVLIDGELEKEPPIWETSQAAAVDCIKDDN